MDLEAMQLALESANTAALGVGFLAGLVFAFNPMVFASIPLVLAYVTKSPGPKRATVVSGAFVAGMLVTHAVLGIAAALGGDWAGRVMGRQWGLVLGGLLIAVGIAWAGWLPLRLPWLSVRGRVVAGAWGAFLLGIPFTFALCPACTPSLLATITASAASGSVVFGLSLLVAFGLGRSVPVLLGAISVGWLTSLEPLTRHHQLVEVVGGVTFIATGLYLISEYFALFL